MAVLVVAPPDLVASFGDAIGVADALALAEGEGSRLGEACTVGLGLGLNIGSALYFPRSHTK